MKIEIVGPAKSPHVAAWVDAFIAQGHAVRICSIPLRASGLNIRYIVTVARAALRSLWRVPDVRVIHSMGTHGALSLILRRSRRTIVVPWGSEVHRATTSRARGWVAKSILRRSELVIVTSTSMSSLIRKRWPARTLQVMVCSWGVEGIFIDAGRGRARDEGSSELTTRSPRLPIHVVAPRGLTKTYGAELLIAGVRWAQASGVSIRLTAIDYPTNSERLSLDLTQVEVISPVAKPELARLYASADFVVSLPLNDQRSTSVLEALATGARLLLSDIPAYREIIDDGFDAILLTERVPSALGAIFADAALRESNVASGNVELASELECRDMQMGKIVRACVKGVR